MAKKSLLSVEKTLKKDPAWASTYGSQILDMVNRLAAKKIPPEIYSKWEGHINFLPHLAVRNPRSQSTPVRICFDASRVQGGGPSLNQLVAKGPDRFLNNLGGVFICFRYGRRAAKGDIRKMYNRVLLEEEDAFCQCFLWRDMDQSKEPEVYQVVVNNIGVKPAGAIATRAFHMSAEMHEDQFPETARMLKEQSYVDDLALTAPDGDS